MAKLEEALYKVYRDVAYGIRHWPDPQESIVKNMEIPVGTDVIEVPCFLLPRFKLYAHSNNQSANAIITQLSNCAHKPMYKTLNSVLSYSIRTRIITKFEVSQQNQTVKYLITFGAILEEDLNPIMMCSWVLRKIPNTEDNGCYEYLYPLLRIAPKCLLYPNNLMERTIGKKIPLLLIGKTIRPNSWVTLIEEDLGPLRLEVADSPFKMTAITPAFPDVSNEDLLRCVYNYSDDFTLL